MTTPAPIEPRKPFEPSPEQLERAAALKRFNRLYVYLPLGIAVAIAVGIVIVLLVSIFLNEYRDPTMAFVSGLADIILILWMLPMILVGGAVLGLIGNIMVKSYKNRPPEPPPGSRFQMFLWRVDNLLTTTEKELRYNYLPKVGAFFAELYAKATAVRAVFEYIQRQFTRS